MNLIKYFNEEEAKKAEKIIKEFHGRMLLSPSINNNSAIILGTYMVSNEKKEGLVDKSDVKKLVLLLGKTSDEFDKASYEVSGKRKGKTKFLDINKDKMGLNFNGLNKIKDILGENKNGR